MTICPNSASPASMATLAHDLLDHAPTLSLILSDPFHPLKILSQDPPQANFSQSVTQN